MTGRRYITKVTYQLESVLEGLRIANDIDRALESHPTIDPGVAQELRALGYRTERGHTIFDWLIPAVFKLKIGSHHTILDLGCGNGRIPIALSSVFGCESIGIEISSERISSGHHFLRSHKKSNVELICADIFEVDWPPADFCFFMNPVRPRVFGRAGDHFKDYISSSYFRSIVSHSSSNKIFRNMQGLHERTIYKNQTSDDLRVSIFDLN